jgi:hypothetical protein
MPTVTGRFEVQLQAEPPFDVSDGVTLGRARFDKTFTGALEATSVVHMTSARTALPDSAAYVAVERITGSLEGRAGSFCVVHLATMNRGAQSLRITVVPDSGSGGLLGLRGEMRIRLERGQHHYEFEYELAA